MTDFNPNVPGANNLPSQDQPVMQQNNQASFEWVEVDHIGYNQGPATGFHKLVTYNTVQDPPSPANTVGINYTANGAVSAFPNLFYKNSQATFMLSCLRAFGVFTTTAGNANLTLDNGFGVLPTITKPGPGQGIYTINLSPNVVSGNNVVVFTNATNTASPSYSFASGVLTITFSGGPAKQISFLVMQA